MLHPNTFTPKYGATKKNNHINPANLPKQHHKVKILGHPKATIDHLLWLAFCRVHVTRPPQDPRGPGDGGRTLLWAAHTWNMGIVAHTVEPEMEIFLARCFVVFVLAVCLFLELHVFLE